MRRRCAVALTAPLAALLAAPLTAEGLRTHAVSAASPTAITGALHLSGCAAAAAGLRLSAEPLAVATFDQPFAVTASGVRRVLKPARHMAHFDDTVSPHAFTFSIAGLQPATMYRLQVGVAVETCGSVFWRGPADGLAVAGTAGVLIEGFAAGTEVEMRDSEGDFVGADALDPADLESSADGTPRPAMRTLRWSTRLAGVTAGELQLATEAYPTDGAFGACDEAPGSVILRQTVAAPAAVGEWVQVELDFGGLLTPPPCGGAAGASGAPLLAPECAGGGARAGSELARLRAVPGSAASVPTLSPAARRMFLAGRPLYLRVVPLTGPPDGASPRCDIESDGVAGWVVLGFLHYGARVEEPPPVPRPLDAGGGQQYLPPYFLEVYGQNRPTYDELGYKVIRDHTLPQASACSGGFGVPSGLLLDPLGCMIVKAGWLPGGSTAAKGFRFPFQSSTSGGGGGGLLSSFTNSLGSLATAIYKLGGLAVDALHDLSEAVKTAVAEVVVSVIEAVPGIGDVCQAYPKTCSSLVKSGLEAGLTSMGVPPSLPNWEQLKDQGIEYLAAEIATQVASSTGLPPDLVQEFTEEQIHQLAEQAVAQMDAKRGGPAPQYDWVIPDLGFEPASWTVTMTRTTADPVPSNLYLRRPASYLFTGADVPVPSKFPARGTLTIPMVLQPNLAGIPAPVCQTDRAASTTCLPSPSKAPRCFKEGWKNQSEGWVWTEYACSWTDLPAKYYRDRWTQHNLEPTACAALVAGTYADVGGLFIPSPSQPFAVTWLVRPSVPALGVSGPTFFACLPIGAQAHAAAAEPLGEPRR